VAVVTGVGSTEPARSEGAGFAGAGSGIGSSDVSVDSPNIDSLDRWAFDVRKVEKPWGYELIWAHTDAYVGKVLFVKAGHALSLQFHREKDEAWLVQSGRAKLELGKVGESVLNEEVIGPGAAFHYVPGTVHRVTALEDTTILEDSTPHLDDVVRLEDAYGREGTSNP
jgi:mannose-6-phosphate isomerase-like protein (cupin superfamily)